MKKLSVLVITDGLHFIGGAETYVNEFATIFKKYGNKIDCLTYFQDPYLKSDSKFRLLFFNERKFNFLGLGFSRFLSFVCFVNSLVKKKKYSHIFLHLYTAPFIICLFNFFPNAKKYTVVHGVRYLEIKSTITPPKKYKFLGGIKRKIKFGPSILFYKFIQNYVLKKALGVIVLSHYAKQKIIAEFAINQQKIHVIPGAIDNNNYRTVSTDQKKIIKQKLGFSNECKLIVLVSRVEPRKNILAAIAAMAEIVKEIKNISLLIVSPAQDAYNQNYLADCYRQVSTAKLGEHVVFITGANRKKAISYYQAADVALIISSDLETFGYTLIEALACGAPVVGTNVGNIPFVLSKIDENLIARVNPKSIAKKVLRILFLDETSRLKLVNKCQKQIKESNNYKLFMDKHRLLLTNEK